MRRILADTSVWIRMFRGLQPWADELALLLEQERVLSHDLIFGELLIGEKGDGWRRALADFSMLDRLPTVPHPEVADFVKMRRLNGRGLGWIDAHLLASVIVGQALLWTADERLAVAADELGVGCSLPS